MSDALCPVCLVNNAPTVGSACAECEHGFQGAIDAAFAASALRSAASQPAPVAAPAHVITDGKSDRPGSGLYGRLTGEELRAAHAAAFPAPAGDVGARGLCEEARALAAATMLGAGTRTSTLVAKLTELADEVDRLASALATVTAPTPGHLINARATAGARWAEAQSALMQCNLEDRDRLRVVRDAAAKAYAEAQENERSAGGKDGA